MKKCCCFSNKKCDICGKKATSIVVVNGIEKPLCDKCHYEEQGK